MDGATHPVLLKCDGVEPVSQLGLWGAVGLPPDDSQILNNRSAVFASVTDPTWPASAPHLGLRPPPGLGRPTRRGSVGTRLQARPRHLRARGRPERQRPAGGDPVGGLHPLGAQRRRAEVVSRRAGLQGTRDAPHEPSDDPRRAPHPRPAARSVSAAGPCASFASRTAAPSDSRARRDSGESHFRALCKDVLFSHKRSESAGGSYGLGKSVLWTFSGLTTVIFNSVPKDVPKGTASLRGSSAERSSRPTPVGKR